jgi:hypothetical protein
MEGKEMTCSKCKTETENLSALNTCPACVGDLVKDYKRYHRREPRRAYSVNVFADGFGRWKAAITFNVPLGNTGEAERVAANAIANAKKQIRAAIVERQQPKETRRLSYEVTGNKLEPGFGRLLSLTIAER